MGSGGRAPPFLTSALDGGKWSASRPCSFTPEETVPGTHCIGGWMGPRSDLDAVEKRKNLFPLLGIEPWPSSPQHVAIPTELYQFLEYRYYLWTLVPVSMFIIVTFISTILIYKPLK
jgi:hypothetical protein